MKAYKMEWVEDPGDASPAKLVNGYFVPAPLYRQMCGVVKAVSQLRYNGYSPRLHIKNVPGSFDLCSKLDKLEQMRRKKHDQTEQGGK